MALSSVPCHPHLGQCGGSLGQERQPRPAPQWQAGSRPEWTVVRHFIRCADTRPNASNTQVTSGFLHPGCLPAVNCAAANNNGMPFLLSFIARQSRRYWCKIPSFWMAKNNPVQPHSAGSSSCTSRACGMSLSSFRVRCASTLLEVVERQNTNNY